MKGFPVSVFIKGAGFIKGVGFRVWSGLIGFWLADGALAGFNMVILGFNWVLVWCFCWV